MSQKLKNPTFNNLSNPIFCSKIITQYYFNIILVMENLTSTQMFKNVQNKSNPPLKKRIIDFRHILLYVVSLCFIIIMLRDLFHLF